MERVERAGGSRCAESPFGAVDLVGQSYDLLRGEGAEFRFAQGALCGACKPVIAAREVRSAWPRLQADQCRRASKALPRPSRLVSGKMDHTDAPGCHDGNGAWVGQKGSRRGWLLTGATFAHQAGGVPEARRAGCGQSADRGQPRRHPGCARRAQPRSLSGKERIPGAVCTSPRRHPGGMRVECIDGCAGRGA